MFNQKRVRRAFDAAAKSYDEAAVLQAEVCRRLLEKLDIVRLQPACILDAGCGTGQAFHGLHAHFRQADIIALDLAENMLLETAKRKRLFKRPLPVCGDVESLPFANESIDLVFSSLSLQWCNDLNCVFSEVLRVLKPGGLFVFSTFGPDTLKELKASWQQINDKTHVNAFIDMHDIGDALLQIGFAEPVMEAEIITVNYSRVDDLMRDLKQIGASVKQPGEQTGLTTPTVLTRLRDAYEVYRTPDGLPASYEIVYGHAWKGASVTKNKEAGGWQQRQVAFTPSSS